MKKKILNNWALKLLSVGIALVIWVIVVNYDNPYKTKTISGIPIEITNEDVITDQNMTYSVVGTQTATVRVTCRRKVAEDLSASDFKAVADFSNLYSATNQIPVTITCTSNKVSSDEITQVTQSLEVELEEIVSQKMEAQVNVTGEPAAGYTVGDVSCSPSYVTVKAPESFLDQVSYVGVDVSVSDVSQNVSTTAVIHFYSPGGSVLETGDIDGLSVTATDISVEVEILNVKTVNIGYTVTGQDSVADGYQYSGIEIDPSSVDISGRKSVLADISSLTLPEGELDVTGASEDITKTFDLRDCLPEGASLVNEDDYTVTVTLRIEKLSTKTFVLDLSGLTLENMDSSLTLGSEDVTVNVTVEGLEADLEELTEAELSGTVDLGGLEAGYHSVTVDVAVPSGFSVVGTVSVRLQLVTVESGEETTESKETAATTESSGSGEETTEPEAESSAEETSDSSE
ncbi:MAG: hypothetical protein LUF34_03245 [Lachnospiraceae bacterium]|nr:hypothetical protein [Lachnospiraceae bacterium]